MLNLLILLSAKDHFQESCLSMEQALMIRMKHWDLFTRMVLNQLHHFGK